MLLLGPNLWVVGSGNVFPAGDEDGITSHVRIY